MSTAVRPSSQLSASSEADALTQLATSHEAVGATAAPLDGFRCSGSSPPAVAAAIARLRRENAAAEAELVNDPAWISRAVAVLR